MSYTKKNSNDTEKSSCCCLVGGAPGSGYYCYGIGTQQQFKNPAACKAAAGSDGCEVVSGSCDDDKNPCPGAAPPPAPTGACCGCDQWGTCACHSPVTDEACGTGMGTKNNYKWEEGASCDDPPWSVPPTPCSNCLPSNKCTPTLPPSCFCTPKSGPPGPPGPPPPPGSAPTPSPHSPHSGSKSKKLSSLDMGLIIGGCGLGVVILAIILFYVFKKK